MSITHTTGMRNTIADAVDNRINTTGTGTSGGVLKLRDSTTDIILFPLDNPAFGAASSGVITGSGLPIEEQAVAAGEVDNFILVSRDGATEIAGSVTATGGGGDIEVSNVNIADNQDCSLDTLTYTAPA